MTPPFSCGLHRAQLAAECFFSFLEVGNRALFTSRKPRWATSREVQALFQRFRMVTDCTRP